MQKRIMIAAMLSAVVMLLSVGIVSNISVTEVIQLSLDQSLELASTTASYTDYLLQTNMARLYDVSLSGVVDFNDRNWEPELKALETAYQYSIFTDGLFLLDSNKKIVLAYPVAQVTNRDLAAIPDVENVLREKKPFYTGIYTLEETQRKVIFAFAPLQDKAGNNVGVIGGEIDPTSYFLGNTVRSIPTNGEIVIELVDNNGFIITSNNPNRVFACSDRNRVLGNLISSKEQAVFRCHRCHEEENPRGIAPEKTTDMLAFAPLEEAPWGVTVRQAESHIFAPSSHLRQRFLIVGLVVITSAFFLAIAIGKSIVNPIQGLIQATKRIAEGELEVPIDTASKDEIGTLSQSFELMRVKLAASLEDLRQNNVQLEKRVEARTLELERNRERLANLLYKVMSAQEEERTRVARELHDETIQSATALGLSIEVASIALKGNKLEPRELLKLQKNVGQLVDGINRLIEDLRPPMLDDLGLESATRWLIEKHLSKRDITYQLKSSDEFNRILAGIRGSQLHEKYELSLFRIIQEAIINVAKHSNASKVSVELSANDGFLEIMVQDNGIGFDVEQVFDDVDAGKKPGYGILGIRERVTLLCGELRVNSKSKEGTSLTVSIPISSLRTEDDSNQNDDCR